MKFIWHLLILASVVEIQATSWDLNFNFSNYRTKARLLVTTCNNNNNNNNNNNIQGLINLVLGSVLTRDSIQEPSSTLPHISCVSDDTMVRAVNFTLNADDSANLRIVTPGNQPNRQTDASDGQLLEMRVHAQSQAVLRATQSTNYIYAWWFKLKPGFSITDSFTHIFRLNAVGLDANRSDLVTFTLTNADGLHLRIRDDTSQTVVYQTMLNSASATGIWIQAFVQAQFKSSTNSQIDRDVGSVRVILKDINGRVLYPTREDTGLFANNMFPAGTSYVVPRWGIYRQLDANTAFNPSDWQLFQNVDIWKRD